MVNYYGTGGGRRVAQKPFTKTYKIKYVFAWNANFSCIIIELVV